MTASAQSPEDFQSGRQLVKPSAGTSWKLQPRQLSGAHQRYSSEQVRERRMGSRCPCFGSDRWTQVRGRRHSRALSARLRRGAKPPWQHAAGSRISGICFRRYARALTDCSLAH